jgi:hypothetical protein
MIWNNFLAVGGSVVGVEHKRVGRNNQDAWAINANKSDLVAVVCDGCSSSPLSEVGANLMARFISDKALELTNNGQVSALDIFPQLEFETLEFIRGIAEKFRYRKYSQIIDTMFLATIMGAIIQKDQVAIFSLGDGIYSVNGNVEVLDYNNIPPYLGYKVYPMDFDTDISKINLQCMEIFPAEEIQTILLATDGAQDIIEKSGGQLLGVSAEEKIGGLEQFEKNEKYEKNPSLLQVRLNQMNLPRAVVDWKAQEIKKSEGILGDDTTIVLLKRR